MNASHDSAKVSGPGGFSAEVTGSSPVFLAFLALLIVGIVAGSAWWSDVRASERQIATVETVKRLEANTARQEETLRALIWVISRPQVEREALNLQKPDVLRRMAQ